MSDENIKEIYEQVFNEVYPQVKELKRGFLFKVIQIILREEQLKTPEKTLEICVSLGIKSNAYREDDNKIIDDLVDAVFVDRQTVTRGIPAREFFRLVSKKINQQLFDNEKMEEMKWIIVGACTIVGLYFCIKYLKEVQQQKIERERGVREVTRQQLPPPPIPAALCLVVPANIASTLKTNSSLSVSNIADLIDSASYFLCTTFKKANLNEQRLELTDEYISPDSQREVYIRVDVSNGRDLLDKKIPYILKTNLLTNAQFIIKQLACLKNLSGLEVFNRV